MRCAGHLLKFICFVMLCGVLMNACKKNGAVPSGPVNPGASVNADTFFNRLQFFGATKKQGSIPKGPAATSLKISFKDTLYLMDQVKRPIKFLHLDTSKNVSGIYLQVHGTGATYYYDVPEIPEMADNDTVSVILIGIDPAGIDPLGGVPPAGAAASVLVKIIPYDESGQPIAETTRPVVINKINSNPNAGSCGLVLPAGAYWDWHLTLIEDPTGTGLVFYNDFDKVWGIGGQFIKGCCTNGISSYSASCSGRPADQRSLTFPTFFRHLEENIKFFADGSFARFTKELHALPDPDKSNFCGNGPGVVHRVQYNVSYFGTWTIQKLATPFNGDSLNLTFFTTSKAGGTGYGRSGGIIHQLDCNILTLIKPDREGFGRHEVSFFTRISSGKEAWYPMN